MELVRYIHLNPLRAGVVKDLKALGRYEWGGHSVLMGQVQCVWQDTDYVLRLFGKKVAGFYQIDDTELKTASKARQVSLARSILCYLAVRKLLFSCAEVARVLQISPSAVSKAVTKGHGRPLLNREKSCGHANYRI